MADSPKKKFARWLAARMRAQGYELEGSRAGGRTLLAKQSGLSLTTISRLLEGRAEPSINTLRLLADALECSIGDMLVGSGLAHPGELAITREVEVPTDLARRRLEQDTSLPEPLRRAALQAYDEMHEQPFDVVLRALRTIAAREASGGPEEDPESS